LIPKIGIDLLLDFPLDTLSALVDNVKGKIDKRGGFFVKPVLTEILEYCERHKVSPRYMTKLAVNNSEIVPRLEAGGTITLATYVKLQEYMAKNDTKQVLD